MTTTQFFLLVVMVAAGGIAAAILAELIHVWMHYTKGAFVGWVANLVFCLVIAALIGAGSIAAGVAAFR